MADLTYARQLLESGELSQAEAQYHQLLDDPATRSEALYGIGLVSFRRRDYDAAEGWFNQSLKGRPNGESPRYYLGEIASVRGDRNRAIQLYATILVSNPAHLAALSRIASFATSAERANLVRPPGDKHPAHRSTNDLRAAGPAPQPSASPVASAPARAALRPPRPPYSKRSTVGIAEHVKLQVIPFNGQAASRQLLTLRVRIIDPTSRSERSVGIEMRGFKIRGNVENGDWLVSREVSSFTSR
jgi:tetratricopeptide (TPR) repeat protein